MTATTPRPARPKGWTADRVHQAVWEHFATQGWAVLEEVTTDDPSAYDEDGRWNPGSPTARRVDVLAVRRPKAPVVGGVAIGDHQLLALEIKVTRADFASDVNNRAKQAPWREIAHQHAYVVPEGLVDLHEVPEDSGLLVVTERLEHPSWAREGTLIREAKWARRAPYSPGGLPERFMRDFAWRAASAQATLRGRATPDRESDVGALHAEIDRLRAELTKASTRADRKHAEATRWRQIAVSGGYPLACATCGHPVRPVSVHTRTETWRHAHPEHEAECFPQREAAAVEQAQRSWENRTAGGRGPSTWEEDHLFRMGWTKEPWRLCLARIDGPLPTSDL